MQLSTSTRTISDEDRMRADLYGLLGKLLFTIPDKKMMDKLSALSGDDSEMGHAFNALAKIAGVMTASQVKEEYNGLFIGVGRGELLPYGSYYLTGFLNEKPLAKLRKSMRELGISRNEAVKEPEDHIGSLFEMMAGLITGQYGQPASLEDQKKFYAAHIEPWAAHLFKDLEAAQLSRLYQPIGTIGWLFIEIETNAFSMI